MSEVKAYVQDGDVGCGTPGSLTWHKCNILQLDDQGKIDYISQCFPNLLDQEKLDLAVFLITEEKINDMNQSERLVYFGKELVDRTIRDAFIFMDLLIAEAKQDGDGN